MFLKNFRLIAIMIGFIWTMRFYTNVVSLILAQGRELASNLIEVKTSHFFVNVLGKDVDTWCVFLDLLPEFDLCERLIGEAI